MITLHTNLKKGGTTQFTGYDFNSYCKFGDHCLACNQTGVDELGGVGGMESLIETFVTKLGRDVKKRLHYMYVGLETDGTIIITPIVDGVDKTPITFTPLSSGRQRMRMQVGRGTKGEYWSFRLENVDGCWFSIDDVQVLPVYLSI
jgi:hypothetical protein